MENYIGIAVHGYRNPDNNSEEIVTRVVAIGSHSYDSPHNATQHETAIKAATDKHPKARWYVGYGADYVPASKSDLVNINVIVRRKRKCLRTSWEMGR